ncbi:MAG TPA: hypothetical protein DIC52_11260, partial [Candidatus Latescibacteria bacterium]|nr:hypothetical protein [Candidatus Latescibacterota bacterium]
MITALWHAMKGRFDRHARLTRWLWPVLDVRLSERRRHLLDVIPSCRGRLKIHYPSVHRQAVIPSTTMGCASVRSAAHLLAVQPDTVGLQTLSRRNPSQQSSPGLELSWPMMIACRHHR